jgi:hypothetical protein
MICSQCADNDLTHVFDLAFKRASGQTKFRKVSVMEMKMLGIFIAPLRTSIFGRLL